MDGIKMKIDTISANVFKLKMKKFKKENQVSCTPLKDNSPRILPKPNRNLDIKA